MTTEQFIKLHYLRQRNPNTHIIKYSFGMLPREVCHKGMWISSRLVFNFFTNYINADNEMFIPNFKFREAPLTEILFYHEQSNHSHFLSLNNELVFFFFLRSFPFPLFFSLPNSYLHREKSISEFG